MNGACKKKTKKNQTPELGEGESSATLPKPRGLLWLTGDGGPYSGHSTAGVAMAESPPSWQGLNTSIRPISCISVYSGTQCGRQFPASFADLWELVAHFWFEMLFALVTSCLQGGMLAPAQPLDGFWYPS